MIHITDHGIGISDSEKAKIFERFYRGDSSHRSKEHSGLGLAIARELALLHNGTLTVRDTPGGGAEFLLALPL